jgi:protein-tyrosine phosphatase
MMKKYDTARNCRLTGAPNFRDLGGYAASDGRRVKLQRVYRSGALADLTDTDLEQILDLDIRLVCDLRSEHERRLFPSRWPAGHSTDTLQFDISADMRALNDTLRRTLLDDPSEKGAHAMMRHAYRLFPKAFAPRLHELFDYLLDDGLPLLLHCTAGKDRTGFVSAILLTALGVPRETVYSDSLLSAEYCDLEQLALSVTPLMAQLLGREPELRTINAINGVSPEYLDASFAAVVEDYGSVDAFLEHAGGLNAEKGQRLRDLLLE